MQPLASPGVDYVAKLATGQPYGGIISGQLPLVWAQAKVVSDSPEKKRVRRGKVTGRMMSDAVTDTAREVATELLIVTPYLIPSADELKLLKDLPARKVSVRILTNSLVSAPELSAHSGYMHYRVPLLESGVQLYEVRSLLGKVQGSGQTARISRFGNYALHAKLFVFDRQKLFLGSMNFDQRSRYLNTEVGLIIDSTELARETALRFDAMVRPENSYSVRLRPVGQGAVSGSGRLVWDTMEDGKPVLYDKEPSRSAWQRFKVGLLSLLPLESEL
jgi:putative cardiolipin synthase